MTSENRGYVESVADRTQRIAIEARDHARSLGAENVIVLVGGEDGSHFVAWKGSPFSVRGLFEIGVEIIRKNFVSPMAGTGGRAVPKVSGLGAEPGSEL